VIVLVCLESPAPGRASRAALDLACSLAGAAQVVVLSAGGATANQSLDLVRRRVALARVVHLMDPMLDQADFFTMGMVLAEAARHLQASLVFTGERSDDEGQGLVPAALAHHLRAQRIARVQSVRLSDSPDSLEVTLRAGGRVCTLACHLPLVLTVPPVTPSRAPADGDARPVETLLLAQLGLDPSRLVPRPDLLGALVPAPAERPETMGREEAAAALARHR
jgi:electron transfer flavoprotein beta subunit